MVKGRMRWILCRGSFKQPLGLRQKYLQQCCTTELPSLQGIWRWSWKGVEPLWPAAWKNSHEDFDFSRLNKYSNVLWLRKVRKACSVTEAYTTKQGSGNKGSSRLSMSEESWRGIHGGRSPLVAGRSDLYHKFSIQFVKYVGFSIIANLFRKTMNLVRRSVSAAGSPYDEVSRDEMTRGEMSRCPAKTCEMRTLVL